MELLKINGKTPLKEKYKEMQLFNPYIFSQEIPRNGLIGEWLFNGNANDNSGAGNNGTVSGAILTTDRKGISNSAYLFNGSTDRIRISDQPYFTFDNYKPFSMSCWVYCINNKENATILAKREGPISPFEYRLIWGGGNPSIILATNGNNYINYTATAGLLLNTWYQITCVYNGSSMAIYVNGISKPITITTLGTYTGMINTTSLITIGTWNFAPTNDYGYAGKLDDIRLYNRVLSADEIAALYNE